MHYRVWQPKQVDRAAALALSRQIAQAALQKQIDALLEQHPDAEISEAEKDRVYQQQFKAAALLAGVLVARGLTDANIIEELLGDGAPLSDPFLLKDMDLAVARIHQAIDAEQTIVVFGDYDVDGVTATALLYQHLKGMGADVKCMLPSREGDGYGLSRATIQSIYDKGYRLIVTVDNGVSAVEEADFAASLGIELVITDHHLPPDPLPKAVAVVDPRRLDDESPFKGLSGAGVAFKLCAALDGCDPAEMLEYCGDLAAIGTVADVMPLQGENRTLVKAGLAQMQQSDRVGLNALLADAGLQGKTITAENISYAIAPRINAAGRMNSAVTALQLVLSEDEVRAAELANALNDSNQARQKAEQEIAEAVDAQLADNLSLQEQRVVVVAGRGWHVGVIGIVASRLVERTARPCVVISIDEKGEGKGSGRSIDGFNLHQCIGEAGGDLLLRYGGHAMAAGLSVMEADIPALRKQMNAWAKVHQPIMTRAPIEPDLSIHLDKLDIAAVQGLERLAPYGANHHAPTFLLSDAVVDGVYPVSEGRHCRLRLRQGKSSFYAAYFGVPVANIPYKIGDAVEAILTLNLYEGKNGVQLSGRIQELRPAGLSNIAAHQSVIADAACHGVSIAKDKLLQVYPSREEIAAVYREVQQNRWHVEDLQPFFAKLGAEKAGKIMISLVALQELGLVGQQQVDGAEWFCILPTKEKKALSQAPILKWMEEQCSG
ncbi:MAG: single-stranded-DNA-specific exonuclease RecJ [Faecalibacterium sp.]